MATMFSLATGGGVHVLTKEEALAFMTEWFESDDRPYAFNMARVEVDDQ